MCNTSLFSQPKGRNMSKCTKEGFKASKKFLAATAVAMLLLAGHAHSTTTGATADVDAEPQLSAGSVMTETELDQSDNVGLKLKALNAVVQLLRTNMRIYGANRGSGVDIDRYSGWDKVMGDSFWRRF